MRLPRFFRTSSFRLTLLYAGVFCASVFLLFNVMFWFGRSYLTEQIDRTVSDEIAEITTKVGDHDPEALRATVASFADHASAGVFYLLQDASGRVLAGNVPPLSPIAGLRSWKAKEDGGEFPVGRYGARGFGMALDDGAYLFVGLDSHELLEMRELMAHAFFTFIFTTIALALACGALMSAGLLRRVETISQTSRDIVAGDLSRRVPVRGNGDEFDHLALSLNTMLDRIVGLMTGLQEVSADIAHDLRTPLTRLRQRLELTRRRSHSVEQLHQAIDGSIADVDAILETFTALLRIAQIEAHTAATALAPFDLGALLNDMVETYQFVAEERGQSLVGRIAADVSIMGDRELLPQLFSNIIENAIRHSGPSAKIIVDAQADADGIALSIADNGPGIPEDMREKVFQRFFRLERSRTTDGTGLGLSLAAAIAQLHGGRIELLDNHPGLRVRMVFPRLNC
jgi:signal transduction histidine kinase